MALTITESANLTAWEDTSTTSQAMLGTTADKVFTVSAGKGFVAGNTAQATATSAAIPTGVIGVISSYVGTDLTITPNSSVASGHTLCGVYSRIWSKTTVTTGTGTKTFIVSGETAHLAGLTPSLPIRIHSRTSPFTSFMTATVTSFNATTGSLVVSVSFGLGSSTISDWVFVHNSTFNAWDISPVWGEVITLTGAPTLTITQTPKMPHKFVNALTNGIVRLENSSTSTMLFYSTNEPTGGGTPSNTGQRYEQNAQFIIRGNWIPLGIGTATANQSLSIPAGVDFPSLIEIESGTAGAWEQWLVIPGGYGESCKAAWAYQKNKIGNQDVIGKVLWFYPDTQTVECGDGTNGIVIPSGAGVRIPNIHVYSDYPAPVKLATALVDTTSTTSATLISSGTLSLTVATGLPYAAARSLKVQRTSDASIWMIGTVASYTSGTGALSVTVTSNGGAAGTYTDWQVLDQISLTLNSADANSGTYPSSNWRGWIKGEHISGTRSGNSVTGITRNYMQSLGLPVSHAAGSNVFYTLDASSSGTNGVRGIQFDLAPSGTMDCEICSFGCSWGGQITDSGYVRMNHIGIASQLYVNPSQGNVDCQYVSVPAVTIVPGNASLSGLRLQSILGTVTTKNIVAVSTGANTTANAGMAFFLYNCPNATADMVTVYHFELKRSSSICQIDSCVFAVTPTNFRMIGAQLSFVSFSGEIEGIYTAAAPSGLFPTITMNPITFSRSSSLILRKIRGLGDAKISATSLISSDQISSDIIVHDVDFEAGGNASSCTGLCANGGSVFTYANVNMGAVSPNFPNQSKASSGLGENRITYRNVKSSVDGAVGSATGLTYSTGLRVEGMTTGQTRMISSSGSNTSYKDCSNYYTTVNATGTTGRLCIGAFAGESALSLYDITGTTYINNDGRLYIEGDMDSAIVKTVYPIRSLNIVTPFADIEPHIWDYRSDTTSTTSNTVGLGSLSFVVGSALPYAAGDKITIQLQAGGAVAMSGTVTSYSGTALVVDITKKLGSGTYAAWAMSSPSYDYTLEFRWRVFGEDGAFSAWMPLAAGSLLTVTDTRTGFFPGYDIQTRVIGIGNVTGRYLDQIQLFTNNDIAFAPAASETAINVYGAQNGSVSALVNFPDALINSASVGISGTTSMLAPFYADGVVRDIMLRVRAYGYTQYRTTLSYYRVSITQGVEMPVELNVTQSSTTAAAHTGITVTDHGVSPVTWQSKLWAITIVGNLITNPSLTVDDIKHYIHYNISKRSSFSGKDSGLCWHDMIPMAGTNTERGNYGGSLYKGVRVVDQAGNPFTGIATMQSDDGTYYTAPLVNTGTVSNYLANTRIIVYNETKDSVEYDAISSSSPLVFDYVEGSTFGDGDVIRIFNVWYNSADGSSATKKIMQTVIASASGWSVSLDQPICATYASYFATFGTTGAVVYASGDFVKDAASLQFDLDDGDNNWYGHRLFMWDKYQVWFNASNRDVFTKMSATDAGNIDLGGWYLDNLNSSTAKQLDAINITSNGAIGPVVNPTTGGGGITMYSGGKVLTTSSGGIAPSEAQIKAWVRAELSTEMARIDATVTSRLPLTGYTNPPSVSAIATAVDGVVTPAISSRIVDLDISLNDNLIIMEAKIDTAITNINTKASQTSVNSIPLNPLLTTDSRLNNLDALISSRLSSSSYTTPPTTGAIVLAAEGSLILAKEATAKKIKGMVSTII